MARTRPVTGLDSQQQLLERLEHLVQLSSQMIFVSGAAGAGKTTLAEQFLEHHDGRCCLLTCQPGESADQQRNTLLSQLVDEPLFDAADPLSDSAMRMLGETPAPYLLIIDDAQHLQPGLIAELVAWLLASQQRPSPHQFTILLLAELSWSVQQLPLLREQLPAALAIELEMPELPEDDIQKLVGWRYRQAGLEGAFPNVEVIERYLSENQEVTPGRVLEATERCLHPEPTETVAAPAGQRFRRICWMVLLLVALGLLLSWFYEPMLVQWQRLSDQLAGVSQPVDNPPQLTEPAELLPSPEPLAGSWLEPVAEDLEVQLPEPISGAEMTLESPQTGRERVVLPDEVLRMLIANQKSRNPSPAGKPQPSAEAPATAQPATAVSDAQPGDIVPEPEAAAADAGADDAGLQDSAPVAPLKADGVEVPFEEWTLTPVSLLRQKPANHYTLQLAGLSDRSYLNGFLRNNQLLDEVWIYQTERHDQPWYVVLYGDYPDVDSAKQALQALPDSLRTQSPWIKSFKQVQRELD